MNDYRALIIDEAHKLPDAAKQMFGKSLCYDDIREICFYLGKEYQGSEIRKMSGTIRMVLDIIGENHRTRYGIKEEFHMTEECAIYLYEGIQTMNRIIEKLEKKIPKWIRNIGSYCVPPADGFRSILTRCCGAEVWERFLQAEL